MLLEFKMKNFKSFKEEMDLKMTPTQIKDLEYSLITKKSKGKNIKAISTAAIYGPNSSGKTNVIGGMEVFRSIILNGNINNKETITSANTAVGKLELIPNIKSKTDEPVYFYIKFLVEELIIEIELSLKLGTFLESDYNRTIVAEKLKINDKMIYDRTEKIEIGKIETIKDYLIEGFDKKTAENISRSNLDDKELFFNGMFKTLYSKKIYELIIKWFQDKFRIVYHADKLELAPVISKNDNNKRYYIDEDLNKAAKTFGLTSENIVFPITDKQEQIRPLAMIDLKETNKKIVIPAELFESFGTIRFLNIFPMILVTIKNGSILVIDELDASIHPMAIINLINIFHNDEINKNGAQLIFNTHNPIYLNNALLRRDEIKFVEKENDSSILYSLSDFGTSGNNGVRNTEDYIKNYFINKYGAIKDIDFSEIFNNY